MRACAAVVLALAGLGPGGTCGAAAAGNATEWRDLLLAGRVPATLEALATERGCGPAGCVVDVGGYTIDRDRGLIRTASGRAIKLENVAADAGAGLPPLDWDPVAAYRVRHGSRAWGLCLEMAHTGLARSGRLQRWTSVILLPAAPSPHLAYRFVGYWLGCDSLSSAAATAPPELPVVSAAAAGQGLTLVWQVCDPRRCRPRPDPRPVTLAADAAAALLQLGTP
jgi:hypothetical protein